MPTSDKLSKNAIFAHTVGLRAPKALNCLNYENSRYVSWAD